MVETAVTNGRAKTQKLASAKRISLACGDRKPDGFFGVDIQQMESADLVCDLLQFPWPIKSNCAEEISCEHFVEHIPHWRPWFKKDGFFHFFEELHRICKKDAMVTIIHPYVKHGRAYWDPTHERFIHEATWTYLSKDWRERELLSHYDFDVDFEVLAVDGMGIPDDVLLRHQEQQQYVRNHYWDVVQDLVVKLKVRK